MITIRYLNGLGYYWHCSRPGRPGEQSDFFNSCEEVVADARK